MNDRALAALDDLATTVPTNLVPRIFSTIADCLAAMAHNKGGLRSGPAHNPDWDDAMSEMRLGHIKEAVRMMADLRRQWLDSPERMVRAARHYEAAARVLVSEVIYQCARRFRRTEAPPVGVWVKASCPIRADLAGGWTDTPPITYELKDGGVCVNVAINLEGQMPVVASARRLKDPVLVLQPPEESAASPLVWKTLADISDYHQPLAPGALFKCAVIALGLINPDSMQELDQQLNFNVGGGIEVRMKSSLPQGSGLGTSSVLSGALLAVGIAFLSRYHIIIITCRPSARLWDTSTIPIPLSTPFSFSSNSSRRVEAGKTKSEAFSPASSTPSLQTPSPFV